MKKLVLIMIMMALMIGCSGAAYQTSVNESGQLVEIFKYMQQEDGTWKAGNTVNNVFSGWEVKRYSSRLFKKTLFIDGEIDRILFVSNLDNDMSKMSSKLSGANYINGEINYLEDGSTESIFTLNTWFVEFTLMKLEPGVIEKNISKFYSGVKSVKENSVHIILDKNGEVKFFELTGNKKAIDTSKWSNKKKKESFEKIMEKSMKTATRAREEQEKSRKRTKVITNSLSTLVESVGGTIQKKKTQFDYENEVNSINMKYDLKKKLINESYN